MAGVQPGFDQQQGRMDVTSPLKSPDHTEWSPSLNKHELMFACVETHEIISDPSVCSQLW